MQKANDESAKAMDKKLTDMAVATQRQIDEVEVRVTAAVERQFADYKAESANATEIASSKSKTLADGAGETDDDVKARESFFVCPPYFPS